MWISLGYISRSGISSLYNIYAHFNLLDSIKLLSISSVKISCFLMFLLTLGIVSLFHLWQPELEVVILIDIFPISYEVETFSICLLVIWVLFCCISYLHFFAHFSLRSSLSLFSYWFIGIPLYTLDNLLTLNYMQYQYPLSSVACLLTMLLCFFVIKKFKFW